MSISSLQSTLVNHPVLFVIGAVVFMVALVIGLLRFLLRRAEQTAWKFAEMQERRSIIQGIRESSDPNQIDGLVRCAEVLYEPNRKPRRWFSWRSGRPREPEAPDASVRAGEHVRRGKAEDVSQLLKSQ